MTKQIKYQVVDLIDNRCVGKFDDRTAAFMFACGWSESTEDRVGRISAIKTNRDVVLAIYLNGLSYELSDYSKMELDSSHWFSTSSDTSPQQPLSPPRDTAYYLGQLIRIWR